MKRKISFSVRRALPAAVLITVAGFVVTACGGGSGSGSSPRLSAIPAQSVNQDTSTGPITFTVSADGSVDAVTLTAMSSNRDIIAPTGITLGGSGASRTITLVPSEDASGSVTITVNATDANGYMNGTTFAVNVKAVTQSFTTFANTTYGGMEGDTPAQVSGITFTQDADATTFNPLLQ